MRPRKWPIVQAKHARDDARELRRYLHRTRATAVRPARVLPSFEYDIECLAESRHRSGKHDAAPRCTGFDDGQSSLASEGLDFGEVSRVRTMCSLKLGVGEIGPLSRGNTPVKSRSGERSLATHPDRDFDSFVCLRGSNSLRASNRLPVAARNRNEGVLSHFRILELAYHAGIRIAAQSRAACPNQRKPIQRKAHASGKR
jgi:hypothetical protein